MKVDSLYGAAAAGFSAASGTLGAIVAAGGEDITRNTERYRCFLLEEFQTLLIFLLLFVSKNLHWVSSCVCLRIRALLCVCHFDDPMISDFAFVAELK